MSTDEVQIYVVVPIARIYDIALVRRVVEHVLSKHFKKLGLCTWQVGNYSPDVVSVTYEIKEDPDTIYVTVKATLYLSNVADSIDKLCNILYNNLRLFVHELTDSTDFVTIVITPRDVNVKNSNHIERLEKGVYEVESEEGLLEILRLLAKRS